ncbi:hypothetical protein R1sor_010814 [Riccia sorocarpa]|uniref:Transposase n=1 Tax=Riccia sorocarpa TaxID=122646 RepID=A0ABD3HZ60_9MARC
MSIGRIGEGGSKSESNGGSMSWSSVTQEVEEFKRWLKDQLRPQVEVAIGFYSEVWKFSRSSLRPTEFSASMWCVSRENRIASNQTTHTENARTTEKRRRVERYRCQGTINVAEIESWDYGDDGGGDQFLSASNFICREDMLRKGFEQTMYINNDEMQAIAFTTPFWRHIDDVKEVIADSTFKTNVRSFEMFGLIANLGGFGVPLGYMFYLKKVREDTHAPSQQHIKRVGTELLMYWLKGLHNRGVRSLFFVTDKDQGQIAAAQRSLPNAYV